MARWGETGSVLDSAAFFFELAWTQVIFAGVLSVVLISGDGVWGQSVGDDFADLGRSFFGDQ
ncbi:hypothetical protein Cflav_PD3941 [Pedosphaera parvula Ellin514]|uniref:Uncharacterized protein n=1 Tax=Pedosphaera parvula (strain Ellin514) TaxID=320771 RepID=B9XG62_PEDPL|nr:hypothetical protein Cflav_PD3941 [Pedosphaera parvula Ellin514]